MSATNVTELVKQYKEKAKALKKHMKILLVMLVPLVVKLILEIRTYTSLIKAVLLLVGMIN